MSDNGTGGRLSALFIIDKHEYINQKQNNIMAFKMKTKRFKWLAALLLLVAAMVMPATAWAEITPVKPSTGDGTASNPYQIGNKEELYWFAGLVNGAASVCNYDENTNPTGTQQNKAACAVLTANIVVNSGLAEGETMLESLVYDASGKVTNGSNFVAWTPIGFNYQNYTGTFDGKGYTVSGLYFNDTNKEKVGLFGRVDSGGKISNVGVLDSYFEFRMQGGGICGLNYGEINNCTNGGTVIGNSTGSGAGGVCGMNYGTVKDCKNTGSVSGTVTCIGGVCGALYSGGSIENCLNEGTVSGTGDTSNSAYGGVCGRASGGVIKLSSNTASVSGNNAVGGVCGQNAGAALEDCYNTGNVGGSKFVGGVCGDYSSGYTIKNCYNTGAVSGQNNVGGVCGNNIGTITNCYYLSGTATGGINGADAAGSAEGKSLTQFASGEVAYLLSQGENGSVWGQTLSGTGKQDYPVLGGMPVYYRAEVYANTYGILTEGAQTITASSNPNVWYEFTPEADGTYLFVASISVVLVSEDISGVATGSPCIAKELVAETTYYVCILGAPTPQADLTIKRIEASDTLLKVGANTAYITSPDALWYAFKPAETGYYQFSSTDIKGSICVNTEKTNNIMQGMMNSPIYRLIAKTTYYVCFSYAPGEYDLTIAKLNTTLQLGADNAIMVPVSTSEPIWYEFTPAETGTYQFSSADIKGSICVNTKKTDDDQQNITTSPTYSLSAGTTYYVYVNYAPGEYKLTITQLSTTTALEAVVVPQIYAVDGRIVCAGEFRIYDLLGRDVTRLNGSLCGVYVVKVGEAAVKVVVK
ncbi:MAG: GLUG motif-containing protein [Paludibacteraceae bacterium]